MPATAGGAAQNWMMAEVTVMYRQTTLGDQVLIKKFGSSSID
jgi:hypothetical protein